MVINVFDLDGKVSGKIELPQIFNEEVRQDLILRAILSENSIKFQPQSSYRFAGMETSAVYVGRMNVYRTGRHMGIAIRPREKLGGGVQGKVKRIPSATKGRRAHPHKVEKILKERINYKEYQRALVCAIANTLNFEKIKDLPLVLNDKIEVLAKTKDVLKIFNSLNLNQYLETNKRIRKGLRRSTKQVSYKKTVLIIVKNNSSILKAARNIAGFDVCTTKTLSVNLLSPGGNSNRLVIWSESAIKNIEKDIKELKVKNNNLN